MRRGRTLAGTMMLALVAAILLVMAGPAWAAQFKVTRNDDPVPDGCAPGDCSLREAVIAANGAPGPDTITVPKGTKSLRG